MVFVALALRRHYRRRLRERRNRFHDCRHYKSAARHLGRTSERALVHASGEAVKICRSMPHSAPAAEEQTFVRGLNLFDATMVVIGVMIGSGIFIVSADMSRLIGSPGWMLMAWAITGDRKSNV